MIVKNEAANLESCLRPIARLFDEIVIVDTGSTDRTREIAREFTDIVREFPWCDDFSAARNECLRHAQGDWIFWLDADDRIPEPQIRKLADLLKGLGHARQAYRITTVCRSQYECDGVKHLSHFRLFRRDPRLQWKGRVHEQLRPEFCELGFEVRNHPLQIEHGGYADGPLNLKKAQRDIRLLRLDFATDPEDPSTIFHLAMAYARVSNYPEARKHLLTLIEREEPRKQDWLGRAYVILMETSLKMGDVEGALAASARAVTAFPHDIALLYMRAQVLFEINEFKSCSELLLYIRKLPRPRVFHGETGDIQGKWVPILLADCLRHLGQLKQAIELLERTVTKHPGEVRMLYSLGCCYLTNGQRDSLHQLRKKMGPVPQGEVFSMLLYIQDRLHHLELDDLDAWFEKLIHLAPLMPYPRLLRVEYLRQANAKLVDYLAACRDALRLSPNHIVLREQIGKIEAILAHHSSADMHGR